MEEKYVLARIKMHVKYMAHSSCCKSGVNKRDIRGLKPTDSINITIFCFFMTANIKIFPLLSTFPWACAELSMQCTF